jgi:hypothetical protein
VAMPVENTRAGADSRCPFWLRCQPGDAGRASPVTAAQCVRRGRHGTGRQAPAARPDRAASKQSHQAPRVQPIQRRLQPAQRAATTTNVTPSQSNAHAPPARPPPSRRRRLTAGARQRAAGASAARNMALARQPHGKAAPSLDLQVGSRSCDGRPCMQARSGAAGRAPARQRWRPTQPAPAPAGAGGPHRVRGHRELPAHAGEGAAAAQRPRVDAHAAPAQGTRAPPRPPADAPPPALLCTSQPLTAIPPQAAAAPSAPPLAAAPAAAAHPAPSSSSGSDAAAGAAAEDPDFVVLDREDFVVLEREDAVEAIAYYIAAYVARTPEAQRMEPRQLHAALQHTFKVRPARLRLMALLALWPGCAGGLRTRLAAAAHPLRPPPSRAGPAAQPVQAGVGLGPLHVPLVRHGLLHGARAAAPLGRRACDAAGLGPVPGSRPAAAAPQAAAGPLHRRGRCSPRRPCHHHCPNPSHLTCPHPCHHPTPPPPGAAVREPVAGARGGVGHLGIVQDGFRPAAVSGEWWTAQRGRTGRRSASGAACGIDRCVGRRGGPPGCTAQEPAPAPAPAGACTNRPTDWAAGVFYVLKRGRRACT